MGLVKRLFFLIHRNISRTLLSSSRIKELSKSNCTPFKLVADALKKCFKNEFTVEDKNSFEKIEIIRKNYKDSHTKLSIIDYGAGSLKSNLTPEAMTKGRALSTTLGEIASYSIPFKYASLLYCLIRKFMPISCLELGTCLGISASYIATALKMNTKGKLITLEGSASIANVANNTFEKLNLDNSHTIIGRFQDTLDNVLENNKPIDFAFIDGHHDQIATILYFEKIKNYISSNALIVFDDIDWSDGMRNAWRTIYNDKCVSLSIDLNKFGICFFNIAEQTTKKHFRITI